MSRNGYGDVDHDRKKHIANGEMGRVLRPTNWTAYQIVTSTLQGLGGLLLLGTMAIAIWAAVNGQNAVDRSNPSAGKYALASTLGTGSAGGTWYPTSSSAYYQRIKDGGQGNDVVVATFETTGNMLSVPAGVGTYNLRVDLPIAANCNLTSSTLSGVASVSGYGLYVLIADRVASSNDICMQTVQFRERTHYAIGDQ